MNIIFKIVLAFGLLFFVSCQREGITDPIDENKVPGKPFGLRIYFAVDGEIGIEWNRNLEANLKGYNIYRSINRPANFTLIAFTKEDYYNDLSLEYDSTYYYKISAVSNSGKESELSDAVSAKPINYYRPVLPYSIGIAAKNLQTALQINIIWNRPLETDIKGYEIFRSLTESFEPDSSSLYFFLPVDEFLKTNGYIDKNVNLLTRYYYKIRVVDKGNLKSSVSQELTDLVLDPPQPIWPVNNALVENQLEFRLISCGAPARYKIIIQSNEIYGPVAEVNFESAETGKEIKIIPEFLALDYGKTYFWRVLSYTNNSGSPNSFSDLHSFIYYPK